MVAFTGLPSGSAAHFGRSEHRPAPRQVLVMHNPTLAFDRRLRKVAFQALRDFVDERGLEMSAETRCAARRTLEKTVAANFKGRARGREYSTYIECSSHFELFCKPSVRGTFSKSAH